MIDSLIINLRRLKRFFQKISFPGNLRLWVTFTSLIFVGYAIGANSAKLGQIHLNRLSLLWLLLSTFISTLSIIVNAYAWRSLLFWLGYRSTKIDLISLFLRSNLLKYLPGGIWHFVERIRVLKLYIGSGNAIASVLLEPLLMLAAALLWVPLGGFQSGMAILCTIPALMLFKRFREPLIRRLENLKASQLEEIYYEARMIDRSDSFTIGRDDYPIKTLSIEMLFVLLRFGGFWCCLNAFSLQNSIPLFEWLAAFSLAWSIGLVVPGAPGGIGIFESILLLCVRSIVPEAPLLAALLCYRLVSTIVDLLASFGETLGRKLYYKV